MGDGFFGVVGGVDSGVEVMVFGQKRLGMGFDESTFDILEADKVFAVFLC